MPAAANKFTAVPAPRLVVAGTHSGSGKTTVAMGLMAAYTRLGRRVQPFKVGPDYIDPSFHRFVTGRFSSSLDAWMLSEDTVKHLFLRRVSAPEKDSLSIIEGVMGLFDGQGTGWAGSTAHVAKILDAPVLLVVDGQGMSLSAAALVSGYASFMPGCVPAGILFNRLSGDKHYRLLSEIVQGETGLPCFGYLARNRDIVLQRRHLGLVPGDEVENLAHIVNLLADAMEKTVDLEGLAGLASAAPALAVNPERSVPEHAATEGETPGNCRLEACCSEPKAPRIGVFMDKAFSFYYRDNLDLLKALGAELVFVSPLRDAALPEDLCGVYLGGGFPEVFAGELAANKEFRTSLCTSLEAGMPAYAECGGLMYLMEVIETLDGERHPMTGFFKGRAIMTKKLGPFGYVTVELLRDSVLGPVGTTIRAHEFHHSRLESREGEVAVSRKENGESWMGGLAKNNVLAWYPHVHFHAAPEVARSFVTACHSWQSGGSLSMAEHVLL